MEVQPLASFFQAEKKNIILLCVEAVILLMTIIAIPILCIKPMSGESSISLILIQKIIPSILLLHIAASAVWDARYGMTLPYFFVVSLALFGVSCVTQAIALSGPSFFVGYFVESETIGRLLCLLQVLIGFVVCVLFCALTGYLEERLDRPLCGAGDIKCMISFFFFPLPLDYVCKALLTGLVLLLAVSLIVRLKNGQNMPVRGLPWLYIGTVPVLLYFY